MSHSRHHEQTVEVSYAPGLAARLPVLRQESADLIVVLYGAEWGDARVSPAMVLNQLAAASPKRSQVRVVLVQHWSGFLVGKFHVAVEVQRAIVPFQVLEYDVGIKCISEHELK